MSRLELSEIKPCISEAKVGEIILLRRFDVCLSLDIIAVRRFQQEGILKVSQIFFDRCRGDFRFLHAAKCIFQFFGIGERTYRRGYDIQKVFELALVADSVPSNNVPNIDFVEQILKGGRLVRRIPAQSDERYPSIEHILR